MGQLKDLRGQRFGRLTVIDLATRKDGHSSWWVCKCDCGNTVEVRRSSLVRGFTKSCGCLRREMGVEHGKAMLTKHGWYGTRLYHIWRGIVDRCENPKLQAYKYYGGRGISICEEWRHHPEAFCQWAMDNGYADNLTIDRIDVNGNYEPSNCRWATNAEQQVNKRNCVEITYNGKTQCVAEWARELGLRQPNLYQRIDAGWTDPKEILFGR